MDKHKPSTEHLHRSLSQLHTELMRTPQADDASKRLLREVLGDIERLLSAAGAAPAPGTASRLAPQSRLEALAVGFEVEHPALAASLREFIGLLERAGL
jgi:hypothetical protein